MISLPDNPADVLMEIQADRAVLSVDTRTVNKGSNTSSSSVGSNAVGGSNSRRNIVVDVREFRSTLVGSKKCISQQQLHHLK